jgi:hypothetical protein
MGEATLENEYSFDSPMHSLSLASPSPPAGIDDKTLQSDVDMSDEGSIQQTPPQDARLHSGLVPRQVKQIHIHRNLPSTAPLYPSPLVNSQRFHSSSTQSNSSRIGEISTTSSQSSSSEDSPNKRTPSQSSSCTSSPRQTRPILSQYSNKSEDNILGHSRTPSPSPLFMSSTDGDSRRLHPSPGLSQTPFPGGRQMLRYTMGYREDCVACKSKSEYYAIASYTLASN